MHGFIRQDFHLCALFFLIFAPQIRACDGVAYGLGAASKGQLGIGYQAASEGTLLRFFTRTHRKVLRCLYFPRPSVLKFF